LGEPARRRDGQRAITRASLVRGVELQAARPKEDKTANFF
jgi:hypothetical protein